MSDDDVARIHPEQNVFGAPGHRAHDPAGQSLCEIRGNGDPQVGASHRDRVDALALDNGRQAAANSLDFGKLGH